MWPRGLNIIKSFLSKGERFPLELSVTSQAVDIAITSSVPQTPQLLERPLKYLAFSTQSIVEIVK